MTRQSFGFFACRAHARVTAVPTQLWPFCGFSVLQLCISRKIWLIFKTASSSQFEALCNESCSPSRAEPLKVFLPTPGGLSKLHCTRKQTFEWAADVCARLASQVNFIASLRPVAFECLIGVIKVNVEKSSTPAGLMEHQFYREVTEHRCVSMWNQWWKAIRVHFKSHFLLMPSPWSQFLTVTHI